LPLGEFCSPDFRILARKIRIRGAQIPNHYLVHAAGNELFGRFTLPRVAVILTLMSGTIALPRVRVFAWCLDCLVAIGLGVLFGGLGWLVSLLYWLIRDGLFDGQSLGKRLMRIRVVVGPEQSRCTFAVSAVRNLLWVLPVMNIAVALTGLYYLLHDPNGQHWGDRLARTRVVTASAEL